MKSVLATSAPFTFKYNGNRSFEFDPATAVLVTDIEAKTIVERFGSTVIITDMEPDAIEVPVVEVPTTPEPEPAPLEVVPPPVEETVVIAPVEETPVQNPAPEAV